MSKQPFEDRIRSAAASAASDAGTELIHSEVVGGTKNRTVRIFIDKATGISHDDCAAVSTRVSELIDSEEFFPDGYLLEVSSPGLERGLYSLDDFRRFSGSMARIKTQRAISGQKHYRGTITGIDGDDIMFDDRTSGQVRIPLSAVDKANIEIDFEEELRKVKR